MPDAMAYLAHHDGQLTALCPGCGATFRSDGTSALLQLVEHQKTCTTTEGN